MVQSKAWDWSKDENSKWLIPEPECCYLAETWQAKGFTNFLDLGSGLGRHSVYFAQKGFVVNAVDFSDYAVNYLREWAVREKLSLAVQHGDMLDLPFADEQFDCMMSYNVIYHIDTPGFIRSVAEITRVLKPEGELFLTLLSKNTGAFQNADPCRRVDGNTVIRDGQDTERHMAHFYVDINDSRELFAAFHYVRPPVEQTEYNTDRLEAYSTHFHLLLKKKGVWQG